MPLEIVSLPFKLLFKSGRLCKADLRPFYPEQKELCKLPRISLSLGYKDCFL